MGDRFDFSTLPFVPLPDSPLPYIDSVPSLGDLLSRDSRMRCPYLQVG
jgi:hypothetical protein